MSTQVDNFVQDPESLKLYQQERSIMQVTELICALMEARGISRADLAEAMNKSRSYVTQLLDGETNMTIRTISDAFTALGREMQLYHCPISILQEKETKEKMETVYSETLDWPATPVARSYEMHFATAH